MKKILISCLLLSLDVLAGPQHIIIPRKMETNRMGALYSREIPVRNYDTLKNYENSRGGDYFRRSNERQIKNRCFSLGDRAACDYVRNYL